MPQEADVPKLLSQLIRTINCDQGSVRAVRFNGKLVVSLINFNCLAIDLLIL